MPPTPASLAPFLKFTSITNGWSPISLLPSSSPSSNKLPTIIHTLPWTPSPTRLVASINAPAHTSQYLLKALHVARRTKTEREIEIMRKINRISSDAHAELMRAVGSGKVTDENEAEAIFVGFCRKLGFVLFFKLLSYEILTLSLIVFLSVLNIKLILPS